MMRTWMVTREQRLLNAKALSHPPSMKAFTPPSVDEEEQSHQVVDNSDRHDEVNNVQTAGMVVGSSQKRAWWGYVSSSTGRCKLTYVSKYVVYSTRPDYPSPLLATT
jgi:hypothetical protein